MKTDGTDLPNGGVEGTGLGGWMSGRQSLEFRVPLARLEMTRVQLDTAVASHRLLPDVHIHSLHNVRPSACVCAC